MPVLLSTFVLFKGIWELEKKKKKEKEKQLHLNETKEFIIQNSNTKQDTFYNRMAKSVLWQHLYSVEKQIKYSKIFSGQVVHTDERVA